MKRNDYYYMRDRKNFARKCADANEESLKNTYNRIQTNKEKYGTNDDLITLGTVDRLALNEPQIIEEEQMKTSYSYGYFERGSRVLDGDIDKGLYSEEEQRKFGIHDTLYNVPEEYLTELKKRPAYLSGRLYALGAKACEFAYENNMSLDDYISFMSIIYPEVTTKDFKEGFLAKENELIEKTKKGSR